MTAIEVLRSLRERTITPQRAGELLAALEDSTTPAPATTAGSAVTAAPDGAIAIVGMSGRYPGAPSLAQYWELLRDGRDAITEIPVSRWRVDDWFDADTRARGTTYSRWIGALDRPDAFDAAHFEITPADAAVMDPQERLVLEESMSAFGDAGYGRSSLRGSRCGVYVGVVHGDFAELCREHGRDRTNVMAGGTAMTAARISYFLDLRGPALAVDTACSSSLVAAHLAVDALRAGQVDMALVAGVALYLAPGAYVAMSEAGMLSPSGRCRTFDDGADGFVPGEGAGAVVLRRLADARAAGDHVHSLIITSGVNQDGRSNGITAPNMASQIDLVRGIYRDAEIDPAGIDMVEMHGTGTKLGDPVELQALHTVFTELSADDPGRCEIGSVKSNIGHTSAAAGIAGLQKAVLCLQNRQFVPSLHLREPNRHFDFASSPFTVTTRLRPWETEPGRPRRAAVSSFGYSGTNAHLVLQEYDEPRPAQDALPDGTGLLVASARTEALLREHVQALRTFLDEGSPAPLGDVLFTLRGRDTLAYRLAVPGDDRATLVTRLDAFLEGGPDAGVHTARVRAGTATATSTEPAGDDPAAHAARDWLLGRPLNGEPAAVLDAGCRRVRVPTCPYERTSYWLDALPPARTASPGGPRVAHPLLGVAEQHGDARQYRVRISPQHAFVRDHVVDGATVVPAAAIVELARAAGEDTRGAAVTRLRDVVWLAPVVVPADGCDVVVRVRPLDGELRFEVIAGPVDGAVDAGSAPRPFAEGVLGFAALSPATAEIAEPSGEVTGGPAFYARLAAHGLAYGPTFRGITAIGVGGDNARALLAAPRPEEGWVLVPGLLDAVLQTIAPLAEGTAVVPFAVEEIRVHRPIDPGGRVRAVRRRVDASAGFDLVVVTAEGAMCVEVRGLVVRPLRQAGPAAGADGADGADGAEGAEGVVGFEPVWLPQQIPADAGPARGVTLWYSADPEVSAPAGPAGERVVTVCAGEGYDALDRNAYRMELADGVNHERLLTELERAGLTPDRVVVDARAPRSSAAGAQHLARTVIGIATALVRARIRGVLRDVRILCLHAADEPAGTAVRGIGCIVRLECPGLDLRTVAVDPRLDEVMVGERVWPELAAEPAGPAVRWEPTERRVLGQRELQPTDTGTGPGVARFREGGTYVVVGGTGGLGRVVARHLARTCRARLVLVGRREPDDAVGALLDELRGLGGAAVYVAADVARPEGAQRVASAAHGAFGEVAGILHVAGVTRDGLVQHQTAEAIDAVLSPKVAGTVALDAAFADEPLEVFVLFSSLASVLGNAGQTAYGYANGFQDAFAHERNRRVAAGVRSGRTVSINWPLWADGGTTPDAHSVRSMRRAVGLTAMPTERGLAALEAVLSSGLERVAVVHGELDRVRATVATRIAPVATTVAPAATGDAAVGHDGAAFARASALLGTVLARATGLDTEAIEHDLEFDRYGIDSISIVAMTRVMEERLGELSKTLFFEYRTPSALARHLAEEFGPALLASDAGPDGERPRAAARPAVVAEPVPALPVGPVAGRIAIIGMSGRYPMAADTHQLWRNLRRARDCITEVPAQRWEWRDTFDPDPTSIGTSYTRWGGFVDDVDRFDASFFSVPPVEAELLDPQVRLFLETCWHTVEDAGYTPAGLGTRSVGVFVGAMYGMYELFRGEIKGTPVPVSSSFSAIANRVSYHMDFTGPSIAVDTMCSSSLTSLHLAVRSIRSGESDLAIAGGVNVTVHPAKHILLSLGGFASRDGRCRSFGADGTGYVPGEGVGAVLLKPLERALADGDHVYGVVAGTAVNAGGRTNGFTVPDPHAQAAAVDAALADAGVPATSIDYVEAHGTGTALGDPIEISGLARSLGRGRGADAPCPVGSIKSNIGHLESAAGVAALTKVLLQLEHRELVPSIHTDVLNPFIAFDRTPFRVQRSLEAWHPPGDGSRPRRAGISSFGAGGANTHVVVEEAPAGEVSAADVDGQAIYVLSARDPDRLAAYATDLEQHLRTALDAAGVPGPRGVGLPWQADAEAAELRVLPTGWGPRSVARTLQLGRTPLRHRLAVVADDLPQLVELLSDYRTGRPDPERVHVGDTADTPKGTPHTEIDAALDRALAVSGDPAVLGTLARAWVAGAAVDWSRLYQGRFLARVPLPGYPFARDRFWVPDDQASLAAPPRRIAPLLHANVSDVDGLRFRTRLTGEEFLVADHRVGGVPTLPAVGFLEMALEAVRRVDPRVGRSLALRDVVWLRTLPLTAARTVDVVFRPLGAQLGVEIVSCTEGAEVTHCRGTVAQAGEPRDTSACRTDGSASVGDGLYERLRALGVEHGPSMRSVAAFRMLDGRVVATLRVPDSAPVDGFELHPAVADGALQAALALADPAEAAGSGTRLPFAVDEVVVHASAERETLALVTPGRAAGAVDVLIVGPDGSPVAELTGVTFRALGGEAAGPSRLLFVPTWEEAPPTGSAVRPAPPRTVVLAGASLDQAAELRHRLGCAVVGCAGDMADESWYSVFILRTIDALRQTLAAAAGPGGVQVVVPADGELSVASGVTGLLRTVTREKPGLLAQLVESDALDAASLAARLQESWGDGEGHVRYGDGRRAVRRWSEVAAPDRPGRWQDGDVYLITGGAGGLGLLVAENIAAASDGAVVVLMGRSPLDAERAARLDRIRREGVTVRYERADVTDAAEVREVVEGIVAELGRIDVVVHSAGVAGDGLLISRTDDDVRAVLAPKVAGLDVVELATRPHGVREYLLFSSMASVTGNVGQASYAAGNGYLDMWARRHDRLQADGARSGRALVVNWPVWQEGGMTMPADALAAVTTATGLRPLPTAAGLAMLHAARALAEDQVLALYGDARAVRGYVARETAAPAPDAGPVEPADTTGGSAELAQDVLRSLRRLLAGELKLPVSRIDARAPLEELGISSVLAMTLTAQLEATYGSLPKTLFFEHETLGSLAGHLAEHHAARPAAAQARVTEAVASAVPASAVPAPRPAPAPAAAPPAGAADGRSLDIAIVGLAGRYPGADDPDAFWADLAGGRDAVTPLPPDRFAAGVLPAALRTLRGGFLDGVADFDPLFFSISPAEAEAMDPQERLFLETAYDAIGDSGHTAASLAGPDAEGLDRSVGVFVGVMYEEYQLYGAVDQAQGGRETLNGSPASVANRVSYAFGLHGPSVAVDTMCSSSLVALHLACRSIADGECAAAIAGGVNISVHPNKFHMLTNNGMLSERGHCAAFGTDADGYVPGEGVGAVVLKPLARAEADGDHVYGVVRATAVNHGGRTTGYTVPNPHAQAAVVRRALRRSGTDPGTIGYVEAHGTGTALGDPIEVRGLTAAFGADVPTGTCLIGSVKSNIGHCESAAGVAGLTKVLLQLRHGQVAPSLHSRALNPLIDFDGTPFRVPQELTEWPRVIVEADGLVVEAPRRAGISAFGAGGANAHVIVEEYRPVAPLPASRIPRPVLLSARTEEQLTAAARRLRSWLAREPRDHAALRDLAHTLRVGREPFEERVAFLVEDADELAAQLDGFLADPSAAVHRDRAERRNNVLQVFETEPALVAAVDTWVVEGRYERLLDLWVRGLPVDWTPGVEPGARRITLPGYPFARERYWAPDGPASAVQVHPLLRENVSTFVEQRYRTVLAAGEPVIGDHIVAGAATLPAVCVLEMAAQAGLRAAARSGDTEVLLRDVVWLRPLTAAAGTLTAQVTLTPPGEHGIEFVVDGDDGLASTGRLDLTDPGPDPGSIDLGSVRDEPPTLTGEALYSAFAAAGIGYGPGLRSVRALWRRDGAVLARLEPSPGLGGQDTFLLHPAFADGAVQSSLALVDPEAEQPVLKLPFSLARARLLRPTGSSGWALVAPTVDAAGAPVADSVSILLADDDGQVTAQLEDVRYRAVSTLAEPMSGPAAPVEEPAPAVAMLFAPGWREEPLADVPAAAEPVGARRRVLVAVGVAAAQVAAPVAAEVGAELTTLPTPDGGPEALSATVVEMLRVLRAALAAHAEAGTLVQAVLVGPDEDDPVGAALSAALRTAHLEDPRVDVQLVSFAEPPTTADLARHLASEAARGGTADRVHLAAGRRLVPHVAEVEPPSADAPCCWRSDGVYLVTGGLGGLGRILAEEIVDRAPGCTVVLAGRSPRSGRVDDALAEVGRGRGAVVYRRADVSRRDEVRALVDGIRADFGALDGVVHCAGRVDDRLIRNLEDGRAAGVLAPKVCGTVWLDEAIGAAPLDAFVLVGSLAGVTGNVGQVDYAAGNAFVGAFARRRARRVAAGERHGRTVALHWPLWRDGGLHVDADLERAMLDRTGLVLLDRAEGVASFHRALAAGPAELLLLVGGRDAVSQMLNPTDAPPAPPASPGAAPGDRERALALLTASFAEVLRIAPERLDPDELLERYGVDSVLVMKLTTRLERDLGPLPKTLLFEAQTLGALADRLLRTHAARLRGPSATAGPTEPTGGTGVRAGDRSAVVSPAAGDERIAVIGMSGVFPQGEDLDAFWRNLLTGRDCITEVPPERWDLEGFFDPDPDNPGTSYTRWGGFIDGIDRFDARLFAVNPLEAEVMDPQERMFLQSAWATLEDAGHTRRSLGYAPGSDVRRNVGVFVGVMNEEYQHWAIQAQALGRPAVVSGNPSSVANRVSYAFDFHGPSLAVDSMCSSSLLAVHLACQAIRGGECEAALAGGVNVLAHPNHFLTISRSRMASTDGRCRSFGSGGDGYVPAEGVGSVLLKPLSRALADGDHVWGVIAGSAVNHGGKTNGYTVPNPLAQREVIRSALDRAGVDPARIDYVEAHGTGTALGDPIEVSALAAALGPVADGRTRPIGSVKSNIGHAESAAGIAGIAKVLLQMRHGTIAPSLHSATPNPNLDLGAAGFHVPQAPESWTAADRDGGALPRVAGVSAFGAGGTNTHVVLEEVVQQARAVDLDVPPVFVVSARSPERLAVLAARLAAKVSEDRPDRETLLRIAYTLQVGREPLGERAAFVAPDADALVAALTALAAGRPGPGTVRGTAGGGPVTGGAFGVERLDAEGAARACDAWAAGAEPDWATLYGGRTPRRISLPTYPFEPERHWLDVGRSPSSENSAPSAAPPPAPVGAAGDTDVVDHLREVFAQALRMPSTELTAATTFEELGLDSIYITAVTAALRPTFGRLPATLLFTHKSIGALAAHLQRKALAEPAPRMDEHPLPHAATRAAPAPAAIAVIGTSGRYPKAEDLSAFAANLTTARDCIDEIPADRWDHRDFPEIACSWGGFLDRVMDFDPQFFGIAPGIAAFLDPQERLFVQASWACVEDAGYTPEMLGNPEAGDGRGDVAVFAGVTFNQYGLFGAEEMARGNAVPLSSQIFSIANRVSYLLNLRGPSLAVDTACSSSLYAIHLACEALRSGEAAMAIAGGVNLTLHPSKYVTLAWNQLLASDGHCRPFGSGGDGYVPGEGVGAVLLKPLEAALADRDNVLAVIRGSAVNHGGRANGYFVPNPVAQEEVVREAVRRSGVDARTISYVEAHGTGTALGDPIEVEALTGAYGRRPGDGVPCAIGSVKGNIGHPEAAAGVAQLQKVLLQLRDEVLYPSRLNAPEPNPEIPFAETPFVVQRTVAPWHRPVVDGRTHPRRAGISSFGVGGVNVHLVVEEPPTPRREPAGLPAAGRLVVPLSARDDETLLQVVERLRGRLGTPGLAERVALPDLAWTLQTGRVHHAHRMAVLAADTGELAELLSAVLDGGGALSAAVAAGRVVRPGSPPQTTAGTGFDALLAAAASFVAGQALDVAAVRPAGEPHRASLPSYPFASERYMLYGEDGMLARSRTAADPRPRRDPPDGAVRARIGDLSDTDAVVAVTGWLRDHVSGLLGFTGARRADVDTGFFDLGLESLALRTLHDDVQRGLEVDLDFQMLFDHPTIAQLAVAVLPLVRAPQGAPAPAAAAVHADDAVETMYFTPQWRAQEAAAGGGQPGPVLVLDDTGVLAAADAVPAGAGPVVVVTVGDGFAQTGDYGYRLTPTDAADHERLLDALDERGLAPALIMHAWALGTASPKERLDLGVRSVMALSQALSRRSPRPDLRLLVVHPERDGRPTPELAGLAAFSRSLRAENPRLGWRSVRVAPDELAVPVGVAVWAEACAAADDVDVRLGAQRHVVGLVEHDPAASLGRPSLLRDGGSYLLTGGLGGVGMLVGQHLAASRAARLVLTGRRPGGDEAAEAVRRIDAAGGRALYVAADIADPADVARLVEEAHRAFGPVHGVLHAAGVMRDGYLRSKERADLEAVLRPKVVGTRVLDDALADEPLDVMVLFSSLTARFGNAGQTDYAFANGMLEAFAQERAARRAAGERSGATITVDWPFWADGGMRADERSMRWLEEHLGLVALGRTAGLAAFENALRLAEPELVVAHGHVRTVHGVIGVPMPAAACGGPDVLLDRPDGLDELDDEALSVILARELDGLDAV